jgi:hypothetical protein
MVPPQEARAVVVSFYMPNIPRRVVAAQRALLKRLVPREVAIEQTMTVRSHERALDHLMATTPYETVVVLDIDCVPIAEGAIDRLIRRAEGGHLAGAAQRASHIQNGGHVYVGPFCLAVSRSTFAKLQPVSFRRTPRADVGEELTYAAEGKEVPIDYLWPTGSDDDIWELVPGRRFGHGTVYDGDFWHAFEIRSARHHQKFIQRCEAELRRLNAAS